MIKKTTVAPKTSSSIRCRILPPERSVCDQETDFVVVWLEDGQLGIAPGRKPMIARLGIGPLRIGRAGPKAIYYYVEGGFVELAENVVTVLTERAIPGGKLDPDAVAERLKATQALPATTPELQQRREHALSIAQAQWRVVQAQSQY